MFESIQNRLREFSIRAQVILLMTLLGLSISGIVALAGYLFGIRQLDETIQRESRNQTAMITSLSIDALITEDRPALQTVVNGLKDLDVGLAGVRISNAEGNILASWQSIKSDEAALIEVNREIVYFGQNFGDVSLKWDKSFLAAPLKKRARNLIYPVIVSCLVLGIAFVIFVEFYFIQPVNFLEDRVEAFATNGDSDQDGPIFMARELSNLNDRLTLASRALVDRSMRERELERQEIKLKSIQATAKAKSDFLSLMSHEIRTPLGAILGFAQLLDATELGKEEKGYVHHIRESGNFLLTIINDILDLSKIEARGMELEAEKFRVNEVVADLGTMLSSTAEEKGLKFNVIATDLEDIKVAGDAHRIKQVLMNLAGNAIKFTEEGEVTIRVLGRMPEGKKKGKIRLDFSVRDTGIGMTSEQTERIFSPFSQADATITRQYGGTGLGVSISKELVKMMGGTLKVVSEQGVGSKFYFTLYLPGEIVGKKKTSDSDKDGKLFADADKGVCHRLLIAEDEPVNRKLIAKIFENLNQEIVFAKDGLDCIEILETDKDFDAVFLDLRMPRMHGFDVAKEIRSGKCGDELKEVPIAIMSADVLSLQEAEEVGANAFIMKPIEVSEITNFLAKTAAQSVRQWKVKEPTGAETSKTSGDKTKTVEGFTSPVGRNGKRVRVLVAEDNKAIQNLLDKLLQRLGYSADFAEDGLLCLEKLNQTGKYDAIFSDLRMPNMDGLTLVSKIRAGDAGERYRRMPIALITAENISEEEYLRVDADALITKPIALEELKAFMSTVPNGRRKSAGSEVVLPS